MLEEEGGQEVVGAGDVPPGCTHLFTAYDYNDPACESARQAKVAVVRALWVDHCIRHGPISPHRVSEDRQAHLCSAPGACVSHIRGTTQYFNHESFIRALLAHIIV